MGTGKNGILKTEGFFKNLLGNRILKHAATLISGTVIAQVILIAVQLIIRRMYSADDFGAFSLYMSIVGVLVVVVTMRYELAVVLPKEEKTSVAILVGGIFISLIINSIILAAIYFFQQPIIRMLNFPVEYAHWLYLVPLSTLLFSVYQFFNYWLTRRSAFKAISLNKVCRRTSEGVTQIGAGVAKIQVGLPVGDIVGNSVNIISAYFQAARRGLTFKGQSPDTVVQALKEYNNFPKYQAVPAVLNTLSMLLPVFFLNAFFGVTVTGYFDLSRQILAVPIAFITASLMQVLLKELRDKVVEKQRITPTIMKTAIVLTAIILPFVAIILLWGPQLFSFFFSSVWEESGRYAQILTFAFAIQFVVSPLSICFTVLEKLKTLAAWQIGYFLLVLALYFFRHLPVDQFLWIFTALNILAYSIYFILILFNCKKFDREL